MKITKLALLNSDFRFLEISKLQTVLIFFVSTTFGLSHEVKTEELTKQFMCNESARNSTNTDKMRNDKSPFDFTNNGTTPSARLLKPQTRWRWPQVSFGSVFFELYGLKRKFHANGSVIVACKNLSVP